LLACKLPARYVCVAGIHLYDDDIRKQPFFSSIQLTCWRTRWFVALWTDWESRSLGR